MFAGVQVRVREEAQDLRGKTFKKLDCIMLLVCVLCVRVLGWGVAGRAAVENKRKSGEPWYPGAWPTSHQIPIGSVSGFLLGYRPLCFRSAALVGGDCSVTILYLSPRLAVPSFGLRAVSKFESLTRRPTKPCLVIKGGSSLPAQLFISSPDAQKIHPNTP
eukprot:1145275-Pelagomonas_calceolata.AAC.6